MLGPKNTAADVAAMLARGLREGNIVLSNLEKGKFQDSDVKANANEVLPPKLTAENVEATHQQS